MAAGVGVAVGSAVAVGSGATVASGSGVTVAPGAAVASASWRRVRLGRGGGPRLALTLARRGDVLVVRRPRGGRVAVGGAAAYVAL